MKYIKEFDTKTNAVAAQDVKSPVVIWCEGNDQVVIGLKDTPDDTALSIKQETETATAKDLYLEVQTPPVTMQAWMFKAVVDCSTDRNFTVNFRSHGMDYNRLQTVNDLMGQVMSYWQDVIAFDAYNADDGWGENTYDRIIILSEPATGDLLIFLNANAVQLALDEFAVLEGEGSTEGIVKLKCVDGETFESWQADANNVDFGKGTARFEYNEMLSKDILTWNDGYVLQDLNSNYIGKTEIAYAIDIYRFGRTPM